MRPDVIAPTSGLLIQNRTLKDLQTIRSQVLYGPRYCGRTELLRHLKDNLKRTEKGTLALLVTLGKTNQTCPTPAHALQATMGYELADLLRLHHSLILEHLRKEGTKGTQIAKTLKRYLQTANKDRTSSWGSPDPNPNFGWFDGLRLDASVTNNNPSVTSVYDDIERLYDFVLHKVFPGSLIYVIIDICHDCDAKRSELISLLEFRPADLQHVVVKVSVCDTHTIQLDLLKSLGYQLIKIQYGESELIKIAEKQLRSALSGKSLTDFIGDNRIKELQNGHERFSMRIKRARGQSEMLAPLLTNSPGDWHDFGQTLAEIVHDRDFAGKLHDINTNDLTWLEILHYHFTKRVRLILRITAKKLDKTNDSVIIELGRREPYVYATAEADSFAQELRRTCLEGNVFEPLRFSSLPNRNSLHLVVSRIRNKIEPLNLHGKFKKDSSNMRFSLEEGEHNRWHVYLQLPQYGGVYLLNQLAVSVITI